MASVRPYRARVWLSRQLGELARTVDPRPGWRLPSFLVLGMQKCGTTWLHEMLSAHDQVFLPTPKELHYFDSDHRYRRGLAWYAKAYRDAPPNAVLGEATPNYLWASDHRAPEWARRHFDANWKYCLPERVRARLGPGVRFVVILRDPVARAVSAFYHHLKVEGRIDPAVPFEETARTWGIAHMGFYAAHLQRWFDVFPRHQFDVHIFEEVMEQPQDALNRVCDHVGVRRFSPDGLRERVHGGDKYRGEDGQYYFDTERQHVAISHEDLAMLRELYAPENERLGRMLGRDLSRWWG